MDRVDRICGYTASTKINPKGIHIDFVDSVLQEIREAAVGDWMGLFQLGTAHMIARNNAEASKYFEEAIANCPDDSLKKLITKTMDNVKRSNKDIQPSP